MNEHTHPATEAKPLRQPSSAAIVVALNDRLHSKKDSIRTLEDQLDWMTALANDLHAELAQVTAENKNLRVRCGLPEEGPID